MFLQEHSGCCVDWRHWRGEAGRVVGKTTTEFGNSDQAGSSGDGEKLADSRNLWEAGLGDEVIWAARRVRDQGYPGFLHGLHRRTRSSPCNAGDLGRAGEGRQGVQPQACAACASGGVRVEIQGFRAE